MVTGKWDVNEHCWAQPGSQVSKPTFIFVSACSTVFGTKSTIRAHELIGHYNSMYNGKTEVQVR